MAREINVTKKGFLQVKINWNGKEGNVEIKWLHWET